MAAWPKRPRRREPVHCSGWLCGHWRALPVVPHLITAKFDRLANAPLQRRDKLLILRRRKAWPNGETNGETLRLEPAASSRRMLNPACLRHKTTSLDPMAKNCRPAGRLPHQSLSAQTHYASPFYPATTIPTANMSESTIGNAFHTPAIRGTNQSTPEEQATAKTRPNQVSAERS